MTSNFSELLSDSDNYENGFFYVKEDDDVLYSLQHCNECLEKASTNIQYWKWVIISLQMALQGAYVCHLSDTSQTGALSEKNTTKWFNWYNNRKAKPPAPFLAKFEELHKRAKNNTIGAGKGISCTKDQNAAIDLLIELRNNFTHFAPTYWGIELSGLPNMVLRCVEIIELVQEDNWAFRHMEGNKKDKLITNIKKIKAKCNQLFCAYNISGREE